MSTKNVKIYILFAIIAMLGFNAMAQTKPKHVLAISADKMNVLYAGIPNPITIAVSSVSSKKLRIDWGGAEAILWGIGRYDVSVPRSLAGREVIITVKKGNKVLGKCYFRVKIVPNPNIYVGANIVSGTCSKEIILANPLITARMGTDFNISLRWSVMSYNVTFIRDRCIVEPSIFVEGAKFSDEVINKIKDASSGTIIEFSDIKIQSIAGSCDIEKVITIRIDDDCDADRNKSKNP